MSEKKKKDGKHAGLVSYTCQFCRITFERGTELSLHMTEKHPDQIGKAGK
jgi:hypothetical protein